MSPLHGYGLRLRLRYGPSKHRNQGLQQYCLQHQSYPPIFSRRRFASLTATVPGFCFGLNCVLRPTQGGNMLVNPRFQMICLTDV